MNETRDLGEPNSPELRRNSIFSEVMVIVLLIIHCFISLQKYSSVIIFKNHCIPHESLSSVDLFQLFCDCCNVGGLKDFHSS